MMGRYGVIGNPIGHSLSPLIHQGWLEDLKIQTTYEPIHVDDDCFDQAIKSLQAEGFVGLNVTLPHKHNALALAHQASETARIVGAANTLSLKEGKGWSADNTDVPGFLAALSGLGFKGLPEKKVTVLGAGGSARAVVFALEQAGAKTTILNRTVSKAEALSAELTDNNAVYGSLDQLADKNLEFDLVVNTTSGGYSGDTLGLPDGNGRLFFDLSYGTTARAQIDHARTAGWETADGLAMLVAQAAESFKIWFDQMPDTQIALERCTKAVEALV